MRFPPSACASPMIVPVRMPGIAQRQNVIRINLGVFRRADSYYILPSACLADRRRHRLQRSAGHDDDCWQPSYSDSTMRANE